MAMMTQPMVSSRIAEATMIWPRSRRMKFISRTTMATILTDEIDSAVPRKIAVTSRASGFGNSSAGRNSPSAKPQTKRQRHAGDGDGHGGAADAAHQLQIGLHAGQQQQHQDAELGDGVEHALLRGVGRETAHAAPPARSRPNSEGPSMMPAMSWPITAGWPSALRGLAHQPADQQQQPELRR